MVLEVARNPHAVMFRQLDAVSDDELPAYFTPHVPRRSPESLEEDVPPVRGKARLVRKH